MPTIDPLVERRLRLRAHELGNQIATVQARAGDSAAGDVGDAKDAADAAARNSVADAEVERDHAELREIEQALGAMADGRYGICEDCGRQIDARRLVAQPTALRCLVCQVLAEGGKR